MAQFATPDPARKIADLEVKLAELERTVRSKAQHSHHMRDLADGDLSKVAGGQVPTYNAATGKFLPVTPATGEQPTLVLRSSSTNGEAGILEWEAPDNTFTFNKGGFFTVPSPALNKIAAPADCLVLVVSWADWGNGGGTWSPAGTRHILEITNLDTYSPVSDYRYQHTTPYLVTTHCSAVGKLKAADPMWVTASHNAVGSQGLAAYVSVTRLALL